MRLSQSTKRVWWARLWLNQTVIPLYNVEYLSLVCLSLCVCECSFFSPSVISFVWQLCKTNATYSYFGCLHPIFPSRLCHLHWIARPLASLYLTHIWTGLLDVYSQNHTISSKHTCVCIHNPYVYKYIGPDTKISYTIHICWLSYFFIWLSVYFMSKNTILIHYLRRKFIFVKPTHSRLIHAHTHKIFARNNKIKKTKEKRTKMAIFAILLSCSLSHTLSYFL